MTNQTARVLELLKRFNDGQKICISALKNDLLWNDKDGKVLSEKTIRRDLDVIKEIFPESFELIRGEKGCYKAITKSTFDQFLDKRNLSLIVQTFHIAKQSNLFDSFDVNRDDRAIIESKLKEKDKFYEFKSKPFESHKNDYAMMRRLEKAIYHQKSITIEYIVKGKIVRYEAKPYKILFMHENFYLACEVENEHFSFSIYRISKIKNIEECGKTFYKNRDISHFIKYMQTPFAKYTEGFMEHLIDVVLEVDSAKAYYFNSKKYFNSQQIIETKENGNLIITYRITQTKEIEELIKRWLPHIRVISPPSLKKKLYAELKNYLSK